MLSDGSESYVESSRYLLSSGESFKDDTRAAISHSVDTMDASHHPKSVLEEVFPQGATEEVIEDEEVLDTRSSSVLLAHRREEREGKVPQFQKEWVDSIVHQWIWDDSHNAYSQLNRMESNAKEFLQHQSLTQVPGHSGSSVGTESHTGSVDAQQRALHNPPVTLPPGLRFPVIAFVPSVPRSWSCWNPDTEEQLTGRDGDHLQHDDHVPILLVHGGMQTRDVPRSNLYIYNLKDAMWCEIPPRVAQEDHQGEIAFVPGGVPSRFGHSGVVQNGRMLLLHGGKDDNGKICSDVFVYHLRHQMWEILTQMVGGCEPPEMFGHGMVAVDESSVLIIGPVCLTRSAKRNLQNQLQKGKGEVGRKRKRMGHFDEFVANEGGAGDEEERLRLSQVASSMEPYSMKMYLLETGGERQWIELHPLNEIDRCPGRRFFSLTTYNPAQEVVGEEGVAAKNNDDDDEAVRNESDEAEAENDVEYDERLGASVVKQTMTLTGRARHAKLGRSSNMHNRRTALLQQQEKTRFDFLIFLVGGLPPGGKLSHSSAWLNDIYCFDIKSNMWREIRFSTIQVGPSPKGLELLVQRSLYHLQRASHLLQHRQEVARSVEVDDALKGKRTCQEALMMDLNAALPLSISSFAKRARATSSSTAGATIEQPPPIQERCSTCCWHDVSLERTQCLFFPANKKGHQKKISKRQQKKEAKQRMLARRAGELPDGVLYIVSAEVMLAISLREGICRAHVNGKTRSFGIQYLFPISNACCAPYLLQIPYANAMNQKTNNAYPLPNEVSARYFCMIGFTNQLKVGRLICERQDVETKEERMQLEVEGGSSSSVSHNRETPKKTETAMKKNKAPSTPPRKNNAKKGKKVEKKGVSTHSNASARSVEGKGSKEGMSEEESGGSCSSAVSFLDSDLFAATEETAVGIHSLATRSEPPRSEGGISELLL